ncbi:hypothetical protein MTO96_052128 [Rhipicephalus appendiculatus]
MNCGATCHRQSNASVYHRAPERPSEGTTLWITPEIMKAARQKRLLFRKASQTQCPITFQLAKAHQRSLKAAIHVEHQRYTTRVAEKATENPEVFWSYVNSLRSSRHRPSFNIQGKLVDRPAEVSALFAEQFSSIYVQAPADDSELLEKFSPRDQGAHPTQPPDDSRDDSLLLSDTFSPEALSSAISKINPSPSPGPDRMAPTFFRLLAPQVLVCLCTVFQSQLGHGTVPASWKRALVTPVHKGKSEPSNDPKNYRPISITSIICRTFERVLNSQLLDFLERTKFFPASQHGFCRDHSCDTALATLNQIISHNLDNRTETDLIQLDLSSAFDTLNISLLLEKVKESAIRGCLLRWLANFLIGRSQRVLYCGAHSKRIHVPSGVPQGSVLQPTLFLIYVNDMPQDNRFPLVQYADDTSILAPILCPTTSQDLQEYLTVIDSWIVSNHLKLSPAKSSVMKFSSARLPAKPSYSMRGIPLPTEDSMKILGVTFTSTLDISRQVASVVAKARRVLGFVSRVSKPCGPATFALLYTSLVLPILEYGCAVWSPNQQHLIARIESVQRRASRTFHARSVKSPSADYATRLNMAKWHPLRQRRAVTQMRLLCRLLDGSLMDTPLSSAVRVKKRSGQPEPLHTRTKRDGSSAIPAAVREFLTLPMSVRAPPPRTSEDSKQLCSLYSRHLSRDS